jgi:hypothetical protein
LEEFAANQARQREYLGTRIDEACQQTKQRFKNGINAVLDDLRQRINEFSQQEEILPLTDSEKQEQFMENQAKEKKGHVG